MADMRDGHLLGWLVLFTGVFLMAGFVFFRLRALRLYRDGVTTNAVVLAVKRTSGGEAGGIYYRTDVRFTDVNGVEILGRMTVAHQYRREERISVVYDPKRPKRLALEADREGARSDRGVLALGWFGWGFIGIFVVAGLILIFIGGGDPICDDPTFRDMNFCVQART